MIQMQKLESGLTNLKRNNMTSVEWLVEQFETIVFYSEEAKENTIEQAKEMEKQQIQDAFKKGQQSTLKIS